jgi:hypothetical protein
VFLFEEALCGAASSEFIQPRFLNKFWLAGGANCDARDRRFDGFNRVFQKGLDK